MLRLRPLTKNRLYLIPHAMQRHTCYIAPPAMQSIGNTVTSRENYLDNTHKMTSRFYITT